MPVTIAGVSRRIGRQPILQDIDLALEAGEILCLVGHSGCGKSSLLRLVAGIDAPSAGTIRLGQRVVAGPGAFVEPERRGVGLMFQDYALFPHLSVARNVAFGLGDRPRAEAAALVDSTLSRLGIGHFADRYPHMLSGGEQQRVALARAIAPGPAVLLMDEPFSNLDSRLRETIRSETIGLVRELGATAILVTHDPQEALMVSDRLALMQGGRIIQAGTGRQLYDDPATPFVARFFSDFNEIAGICRGGRVDTPFGALHAGPQAREGEPMLVLIRPGALGPAGRQGGVPARILHRQFCGDVEQVSLAVDGLSKIITVRRKPSEIPAGSETVMLSVNPKETFVFSASE